MSGSGLVRAGLVVSLVTFLGRLSGLLRELALARSMGAGAEADIAVLLLTLPDLLTQVLAAGAIAAVLVPVFESAGPESGRSAGLFRRFTGWALLLGLGLGAGVWIGTPWVLAALAPGFSVWQVAQASAGLAVVAWTLPVAIASAVSAAWLQAQSRFALVTAGTLLFNAAVMVALLSAPGSFTMLGVGLIAAVTVRWVSQVAALGRRVWRPSDGDLALPPGLRRRYVEAAGAAAVVFAAPLVARSLASLGGDGAVATLNYATRVLEVPMGLAIGVVPVILFPRLSAAVSAHEDARFSDLLASGWVGVAAVSVPIAVALLAFGDVAAQLVYAVSGLDDASLVAIGRLIAVGALGLPALGAAFLYQSALHARLDTRGPLVASAVYVGLLLAVGWPAVVFGGGVALVGAMAACQWVFAAALAARLWRTHGVAALSRPLVTMLAGITLVTVLALAGPVWWARDAGTLGRVLAAMGGGTLALSGALAVLWHAGVPLPWRGRPTRGV